MRKLKEIDNHIEILLRHLANIQNEDGSFNTMYKNPHINEKWMRWNEENAPVDTASTLIPLLNIHSELSSHIIAKGNSFLLNTSLDNKLWRFVSSSCSDLRNPYDSDSTSQCSYVLTGSGYKIKNKKFLNQFINKEFNYNTYLLFSPYNGLPLITFLKLFYINRTAPPIEQVKAAPDDWETGTTCNVLLYTGKMKDNQGVWDKLRKDFTDMNITTVYYSIFFSVYAYARLYNYGKHDDLLPDKKVLDEITNKLYNQLTSNKNPLNILLFTNALLFFKIDLNKYSELLDYCFSCISDKSYHKAEVYYTSHPKLDEHPEKFQPNTNFGSPGITCSLYIEFLNIYRKYFYDSYYSEKRLN